MSPITTRSRNEEDEEMLDEAAEQVTTSQPAVSDSRRRRLRARGIEPVEAAIDPADESLDESRGLTAAKGRPTPGRDGEIAKSTNPVVRVMDGVREYVHDVRSELGKVAWLSLDEVRRLSGIVLAVTVAAAAFLGICSFIFGSLAGAVATTATTVPAGLVVIALIVIVSGAWLLRERLFPGQE